MKKILYIAAWLLSGVYLFMVLGFVENEYEKVPCRGIRVMIRDSTDHRFVSAGYITDLIKRDHPGLEGTALSGLNTSKMEKTLMAEQAIETAQVFKTIEGFLVVEIRQRRPVLRVMDRDNRNYYIDRQGNVIPVVSGYSPYILLANGNIDGRYGNMSNVLNEQDRDPEAGTMQDLIALAGFIDSDPFWRSQIEQIYVNGKGEFELIPRVGAHIIMFGGGEKMEDKFFRLNTLYREGFSRKGWNQYEIINLQYEKQVICSKR